MAFEPFTDKRVTTKVDFKDFVEKYMESYKLGHSNREFADSIGIEIDLVHTRTYYLRKHGVNLPKLASHKPKLGLDIEGLNKIVERNKL